MIIGRQIMICVAFEISITHLFLYMAKNTDPQRKSQTK